MLRRIVQACALLWLVTGPALGQVPAADVGPGDRAAIRGVIESQIAAFRRDDGEAAFAHASPAIRAIFGTPEIFMDMVRTGYPQVYRPRTVGFGELVRVEGVLMQLVDLVGGDGQPVIAAYEMERQPGGAWLINGCRLLRPPERAT